MGQDTLTKVTIFNFPPKNSLSSVCPPKLWSPVFCDEHVHKYQTQLCISTKLKKKFFVNNFCVSEL